MSTLPKTLESQVLEIFINKFQDESANLNSTEQAHIHRIIFSLQGEVLNAVKKHQELVRSEVKDFYTLVNNINHLSS